MNLLLQSSYWFNEILPILKKEYMSKNDITGDRLVTKPATDDFRDNYDRIFNKSKNPIEKSCSCKQKCLEKEVEYVEFIHHNQR